MAAVLPQQVLFHGPRQTESYHQAFDALLNLEKVADSVFSRISTKVTNERNRLTNVQKRLEVAQVKVKQVASAKKAVSVFSPIKYPAPDNISQTQPLFSELIEPGQPFRSNYNHIELDKMQERNNLSPVNPLTVIVEVAAQKKDTSKDGLGRLPQNISSVSGLLLFNSETNPYKQYVNLDNLSLKQREGAKESTKKKKELSDAPKSFIDGDNLPSRANDDINYKPILNVGEVPELMVPSSLPLPNVAEFSYESKAKSIAPSFVPSDLPAVNTASAPASVSNVPAAPTGVPDAPPPPPEPSTPSLGMVDDSDIPPPPPPPPEPVPSDDASPSPDSPPSPSLERSESTGGGARNDLLNDIRKGHFNRLKKVKKGEEGSSEKKSSNKKKAAPAPSGGDMWKDLERTLRSRRAAIAEKQKEADEASATDFNLPESVDKDWE